MRHTKVSPNPSRINVLDTDTGALSQENIEIFTDSPENKNDDETQHHLSKSSYKSPPGILTWKLYF